MRTIFVVFVIIFLGHNVMAQIALFKTYKPGSYYDISGKKMTGLIDIDPSADRIYFKQDKSSSSKKIYIKDISAVLYSTDDSKGGQITDSLVVMTVGNKENKRYFAKPYIETPVTKFFYKFAIVSSYGGGPTTLSNVPNSGNNGVHSVTVSPGSAPTSNGVAIVMYQDGNTTYALTERDYIDILSKAFGDQPDLVKRIQNHEFKFNKIQEAFAAYKNK